MRLLRIRGSKKPSIHRLEKFEQMIKYLFQQVVLSSIFFMVWIARTDLPGGEVGMAPILLGLFLLIQLFIGITLSLIFRRYLTTKYSLLIGMLLYLAIYELGPLLIGSEPMIWGIFEDGANGEISRAFSLIPLAAGALTLITIAINAPRKTE